MSYLNRQATKRIRSKTVKHSRPQCPHCHPRPGRLVCVEGWYCMECGRAAATPLATTRRPDLPPAR